MRSIIVVHNEAIKYLILSMFVANWIFIEVMVFNLVFEVKTGFTFTYFYLGFIVFGIYLMIYAISPRKWTDNQAFRISELGIVDHSSWISLGAVRWSEIAYIERIKYFNIDVIKVYLNEPKQKLASKSLTVLMMNRIKKKIWGTPLIISASFYETNIESIFETLKNYTEVKNNSTY